MGATTAIEWCDHTWSPWIGCTRISAACDNCYAAAMAHRRGWARFEAGAPRRRTAASTWKLPRRWNRKAKANGVRERVFPSLCDPFDAEVDDAWRGDLMAEAEATPFLEWLLLTKRPQVAAKYFAGRKVPDNVRLGITAEDQPMLDLRGPSILSIAATLRPFLSAEPLLGGIDAYHGDPDPRLGGVRARQSMLGHWWERGEPRDHPGHHGFSWVIAGGESGPKARPSHPDWFRSLRDQCLAAEVPFFFKQWGEWKPWSSDLTAANVSFVFRGSHAGRDIGMSRVGKARAGAMLDGREWREMPA